MTLRQSDPQFQIRCPNCGHLLRYGGSTSSGSTGHHATDVFPIGADVHHYACTNVACARFWKFGPGSGLIEDPLQVASDGRPFGH